MDIEENQPNNKNSLNEGTHNLNESKNNNEQQRQSMGNQFQLGNRNSFQGRFSNESYQSFGRMSIEEPVFHENQKISLQSNISSKARQKYEKKDLFQNLANEQRSSFHQELFIRDEGSFKEYDLGHPPNQILMQSPHVHYPIYPSHQQTTHYSSPYNFTNPSTQQFKHRSSQGTNTVNTSNYNNSAHNQSQSIIKVKIFENEVNEVKSPAQHQKTEEQKEKVIVCKCPRSKCLLMYCECFSKGILCNPQCSCYQCRNNPDFEEKRQNARRIVLERDPNAFSNKLQVVGGQESSQLAYKRGCNCKKTNCFKKYCQCFYAGVKCTYLCKCQNCMNGGQNAYKG